MTTAWKKLCFISSVSSDFHMIDSLLIAVHAFASRMLMSFSVDETLLPRLVNMSTSFEGPPFNYGDVASLIKAHEFRLGGLCLQQLIPDYVAGFQLGQVYLPEALCHRHSLRP